MTKTQLNTEYSKAMKEAAQALGRRETIELYKKANAIKKRLYRPEP
ncbi:hypothetical protein [Prochlorococcus marinus]|nr:hypothetical protein [Prochlorococcus marinus]